MADDGAPPGVNSAMLTSMSQASGGMNGGAVGATAGFGSTIGGEQLLDSMQKAGNLDSFLSLGSIEDLKSFFGSGAFDDNLLDVFDGTIMSQGNINYSQALAANNLGWGSVETSNLSPGSQLNAKMPKISSKGQEQGG